MMALIGDEYVAGLEVEVQHLLVVKIGQSRKQLVAELFPVPFLFEIVRMLGHELFEVISIHIVHADKRALFIVVVGKITHNVGMLQLYAEFKLLAEQTHIDFRRTHVLLGPFDAIDAVVFDETVAITGATAVKQHFILIVLYRIDEIGIAH